MAPLDPIAEQWSQRLTAELGRPVAVSFGRARRNVIVAKTHGKCIDLRLNRRFADAPANVSEALTAWLRSGRRAKRACATLDAWIETLAAELGPPKLRTVLLRPAGDTHDLAQLARDLLSLHFRAELPSDLEARITWGRRGTRKARHSIQLGSYEFERDLIRIHPVLDQPAVPCFFVRYVVFHELLHAAIERGEAHASGRRIHHSPEFRRREQLYPDWPAALHWQEQHLAALFRSARSNKPMRTPRAAVQQTVKSLAKAAQGWLFPD